jgi:hypothetical protein
METLMETLRETLREALSHSKKTFVACIITHPHELKSTLRDCICITYP